MSKNGAERLAAGLVVCCLAAGLGFAVPASAQTMTVGGIELSSSVSRTLLRLQEDWLRWVGAFYKDDQVGATSRVEDLSASLRSLGMERLPDLSVGAAVRAVEAARQGNVERAEWALAAAEKLDPGRPETAFGRSILAWETGSRFRSVIDQAAGYRRLFDQAELRSLWWSNVVLSAFGIVLLAGGAFVALQMAAKGPGVFRLLTSATGHRLPGPLGALVTMALLFWPLLLPSGIVWLLLYWSVLLWGAASITERVVVTFVWVVAGVMPLVVANQQQQITVELSPPSHAMYSLNEGRLYGSLFSDLGVLLHVLPSEPAVHHLLADLYRNLGEWERARAEYVEVLLMESDNVHSLLNVGAYYFRKSDYGAAIRYFQQAASVDEKNAAAYYNLSQAYSESLLFEDRERAAEQARAFSPEEVTRWLQEDSEERVVTYDGGFQRDEEIRALLREAWTSTDETGLPLVRWVPLALPILALAFAIAFMRAGEVTEQSEDSLLSNGVVSRFLKVAVPGLASVDEGNGIRGFLALVFFVTMVVVLTGARFGYQLPWGLDPGTLLPTVAATVALGLFFGARAIWEVRVGR